MTATPNILEYLNRENVMKFIESGITIEGGTLKENTEVYQNLEYLDLVNVPLLSMNQEFYSAMMDSTSSFSDRCYLTPFNKSNGRREIEYSDYLSARFYGHKIILVNAIKYKVASNGEVRFIPPGSEIRFDAIEFDPIHHGMSVDAIISNIIEEDGGIVRISTFNSINHTTAPFLLVSTFVEVEGMYHTFNRKELEDYLKTMYNGIELKCIINGITEFITQFN